MPAIDPDVRDRLEQEKVVWLTTISSKGVPTPNPVWFVLDGDDIVIHSDPTSHKVANLADRPEVTVHSNSDLDGGDFHVLTGTASVRHDHQPSSAPGFLDKYEEDITGLLGTTVQAIDDQYDTEIRVRVRRVRGA
jgi:PPOX class probable F420-dependent enzyme